MSREVPHSTYLYMRLRALRCGLQSSFKESGRLRETWYQNVHSIEQVQQCTPLIPKPGEQRQEEPCELQGASSAQQRESVSKKERKKERVLGQGGSSARSPRFSNLGPVPTTTPTKYLSNTLRG